MGNKLKKSSTKILVVNDGRTGDFPSKVMGYLQQFTNLIELQDLRHFQAGELETEIKNYDKTIFICNIGYRMKLDQEKMIQGLDKQIQGNLQVFYVLKQGAGSYCVPGCQAQQTNIFVHEIDESLIEKSLKNFLDGTSVRKLVSPRILKIFLIGLLCIAPIWCCLQLKAFKDAESCEKLEDEALQLSQNCINLIQENKRLTEENLGIQGSFMENEQKNCVQDREYVKKIEQVQKLIDEMKLKKQKKESSETCKEVRNLYEQELKMNKWLEKENLELKGRLAEERRKHEEDQKRQNDQIKERDRLFLELSNQFKEALRDLEQKISKP